MQLSSTNQSLFQQVLNEDPSRIVELFSAASKEEAIYYRRTKAGHAWTDKSTEYMLEQLEKIYDEITSFKNDSIQNQENLQSSIFTVHSHNFPKYLEKLTTEPFEKYFEQLIESFGFEVEEVYAPFLLMNRFTVCFKLPTTNDGVKKEQEESWTSLWVELKKEFQSILVVGSEKKIEQDDVTSVVEEIPLYYD